jgi:hypothetical protein
MRRADACLLSKPLRILIVAVSFTTALPARAQDIFTSPVEITGFPISFEAVAPDRNTGQMTPQSMPPGVSGPGLTKLSSTPVNIVFDARWNGTPEQRSTGTAPIQLACDGPEGVRAKVMANAQVEGQTAYDVSCDFAKSGAVFVKQAEGVLYLSYQLFNNVVRFRSTSSLTCHPSGGNVFCPNDPRFTVTFAVELLTVIRTSPTICTLSTETPKVSLHAVNIEGENASASLAIFFFAGRFTAGELAMQATPSESSLDAGAAFDEISRACAGSGSLSNILATLSKLETEVRHPGGLVFRAIHPPIATPSFRNVDQSESPPSLWRPSIAAPPIVRAGFDFRIKGQFFPRPRDPTKIELLIDRDGTSICRGGSTELEYGPVGAAPQLFQIAAAPSPSYRCADRHLVSALQTATQYRFRVRDCDVLTCSPWSLPFEMTTRSVSGPGPVEISLDWATLGTVDVDDTGSFDTAVFVPPDTPAGPHNLSAATGGISDTISITVVAPGAPQGILKVTGSPAGEEGCPMQEIPPNIVAGKSFGLFGFGFVPGQVNLFLDSMAGPYIGAGSVAGEGSFCGRFHSPTLEFLGTHSIIAVQEGITRASITVEVNRPASVN